MLDLLIKVPRLLKFSFSSILTIVLLYIILWKTNQGQDVLVQIVHETSLSFNSTLFFLSILVLSVYNCYFPIRNFAILTRNEALCKKEIFSISFEFYVSKILSSLTLLIGILSLVHLSEKQGLLGFKGYLSHLSVVFFILIIIIGKHQIGKLSKNVTAFQVICWMIPIVLVPVIVNVTDGPILTSIYSYSLLLASILISFLWYLLLSSLREDCFLISTFYINQQKSTVNRINSFTSLFQFKYRTSKLRLAIHSLGLFVTIIFVISNIFPKCAIQFGPSAVITSALLTMLLLVNMIVFIFLEKFGIKRIVAYGVSFVLLYLFYTSYSHQKFLVALQKGKLYASEREDVNSYTNKWLEELDRKCPVDSTIYLVASYGGGIRAAYWTNLVLAEYMDESNGKFYDQVYALSGASGGMVGEGIFLSLNKNPSLKATYVDEVVSIYKQKDFFSPSGARFFGSDLIKTLVPMPFINDRHRVLERSFEMRLNEINSGKIFSEPFLKYWTQERSHKPLLMCSSAWSQEGIIAIYSPVALDDESFKYSVDLIDTLNYFNKQRPELLEEKTINFSTAVLQSARFPIMSPPGSFIDGKQFVDAGYVDNLGAETIINLLDVLQRQISLKGWNKRFKIRTIIINSEEKTANNLSSNPPLCNAITSFLNLRNGYHKSLKKRIKQKLNELELSNIQTSIVEGGLVLDDSYEKDGKLRKNIYPLGWYLSDLAIDSMRAQLKDIDKDHLENNYLSSLTEELHAFGLYPNTEPQVSHCAIDTFAFTFVDSLLINFDKYEFTNKSMETIEREVVYDRFHNIISNSDSTLVSSLLKLETTKALANVDSVFQHEPKATIETKKEFIRLNAFLIDQAHKGKNIKIKSFGSADGNIKYWERHIHSKDKKKTNGLEAKILTNEKLGHARASHLNYLLNKNLSIFPNVEFLPVESKVHAKANNPKFRMASLKVSISDKK